MIDLALVFERLRPAACYRLNSAVPPHFLVEWRDCSPIPSDAEISECWGIIEKEKLNGEKKSFEERLADLERLVYEKEGS